MKYTDYEFKNMIKHANEGYKIFKDILYSHTCINKIILIKNFIKGILIGIARGIKEISNINNK